MATKKTTAVNDTKFYTFYNRPKKRYNVLDYETKFVSQAEADMNGLKYQIQRYGMDTLLSRFEDMKSKFGYADTRLVPSFAELQNRIVAGQQYFESLPSEIRQQFGHRPENYFEFIEKNPKEAYERGFISEDMVKSFNIDIDDKVSSVQENPPIPNEKPVADSSQTAADETPAG